LPTTTTPLSETTKRFRSAAGVDTDLGAGLDHHVLVDDRVLDDRSAPDVDAVHEHGSGDLGVRVNAHAGRDDRSTHRPARDDDARAHERVERLTDATGFVEHELGGRQRLVPRQDRPFVVVEVEDRSTEIRSMCAS